MREFALETICKFDRHSTRRADINFWLLILFNISFTGCIYYELAIELNDISLLLLPMFYTLLILCVEYLNYRIYRSFVVSVINYVVIFEYFVKAYVLIGNEGARQNFSNNSLTTFTFDSGQFLTAFSVIMFGYIFFTLGLIFFSGLFRFKIKYTISRRLKERKSILTKSRSAWFKALLFLLVLQFFFNWYMFSNNMGIVGVFRSHPAPLKIEGLLYYYRYYLFPLMEIALLFLGGGKKYWIVLLLLLEAVSAGISAISHSVLILHLFPLAIYLVMNRVKGGSILKYIYMGVLFMLMTALYLVISYSRLYVYALPMYDPSIDLVDLFNSGVSIFSGLNDDSFGAIILEGVLSPYLRIMGLHEFLTSFFANAHAQESYGINPFLETYMGVNVASAEGHLEIKELFGVDLDEFGGFGFDLFGNIYRCTGGIVLFAVLSFFTSAIIAFANEVVKLVSNTLKFPPFYYVCMSVFLFKFIEGWFYQVFVATMIVLVTLLALLGVARKMKTFTVTSHTA